MLISRNSRNHFKLIKPNPPNSPSFDLLTTSLSLNSRYWKKSKLSLMFYELQDLPSFNKVVILDYNHPDCNLWKFKHKNLLSSINNCIIEEINVNSIENIPITKSIITSGDNYKRFQNNEHLSNSYLISKLFLLKYKPQNILYYGKYTPDLDIFYGNDYERIL
jgi:hypothetical protein